MRCCLSFCENSSEKLLSKPNSKSLDVTFHGFPTTQWLRHSWLVSLGMEEIHLPGAPVICSQHFRNDDFQTGTCILKSNAVPTATQVCVTCLDTTSKLYPISKYHLAEAYNNVTGLSISKNSYRASQSAVDDGERDTRGEKRSCGSSSSESSGESDSESQRESSRPPNMRARKSRDNSDPRIDLLIDHVSQLSNYLQFCMPHAAQANLGGSGATEFDVTPCSSTEFLVKPRAKWVKNLVALTAKRRGQEEDLNHLFITVVGKARPASRTVIGVWLKSVLREAGITASPGSFRSAVASASWIDNHPMDDILARGNWKSEQTFQKFYCKEIERKTKGSQLLFNHFKQE
ncbi:jg6260 [Pararge aegeria aegeria]|uniref:Jg6260 protein n=1 Tax=Pararge aegeria aegeria TaxID=348720 RepID=A0A8S4QWS9_9NEOP|nr:jg6260 [Pararge aegeria aegeria]